MHAFAVNRFSEPLERIDREDPVPQGTEVVMEVTRCGVCHTDLHLQDGYYDLGGGKRLNLVDRGIKPPVVLGHEVLGTLAAAGPDAPVDHASIGRSFLVYPWIGCGECETCRRGDENLCMKPQSLGVFRPGGYADKCVVPHPRYLVDVTGIDPTVAATYACSGLTAYSALRKITIARDSDLLLILGFGGVGMSGLQIAQGLGYRRIAVAEIDPAKRALASRSGATLVIDPRDEGAATQLAQAGGVSAAIDFVGARATAEFSIAALRKGGTHIAVGLFGGDITLPLVPLVQRAITVRGSYVGNLSELQELIALVQEGRIQPLPVEALQFAAINDALDRLRGGKVHGRLVLAR